jgi:hypothetical protein
MLGQYQKEGWVSWGYHSNFEDLQISDLMISKLIYGSQAICFVIITLKFGFFHTFLNVDIQGGEKAWKKGQLQLN